MIPTPHNIRDKFETVQPGTEKGRPLTLEGSADQGTVKGSGFCVISKSTTA
jgi:hypothetical protein